MAKIQFLHSNSCRVNQRTQFGLFTRNWGDELCRGGEELSKKAAFPPMFGKQQFASDFSRFVLFA